MVTADLEAVSGKMLTKRVNDGLVLLIGLVTVHLEGFNKLLSSPILDLAVMQPIYVSGRNQTVYISFCLNIFSVLCCFFDSTKFLCPCLTLCSNCSYFSGNKGT